MAHIEKRTERFPFQDIVDHVSEEACAGWRVKSGICRWHLVEVGEPVKCSGCLPLGHIYSNARSEVQIALENLREDKVLLTSKTPLMPIRTIGTGNTD